MRLEILGYVSNMYIKYSTIKEILNFQNTEVSPLHYRQLLKSHKLFPNKPGEHDLDFFLIFFFTVRKSSRGGRQAEISPANP